VAGAAALLKALNPAWTPGHIKSALMLTANPLVQSESGAYALPINIGSGRVKLDLAAQPGLAITPAPDEFTTMAARLWDVNYPSLYLPALPGAIAVQRRLENLEPTQKTWNIFAIPLAADLRITVPPTVVLPAHGSAPISIFVDASTVPVGYVRIGFVVFIESGGMRALLLPITLTRKQGELPITSSCAPGTIRVGSSSTCTVTVSNIGLTDADLTVVDVLPTALQVVPGSIVNANRAGNVVYFQGPLDAAPAGIRPVRQPRGRDGSSAVFGIVRRADVRRFLPIRGSLQRHHLHDVHHVGEWIRAVGRLGSLLAGCSDFSKSCGSQ
jgi:uncharacterized repeat protein (TIGR01451 family)